MRLELNCTMFCNMRCRACNRMVDYYPERTEHMDIAQIQKFIKEIEQKNVIVDRMKLIGGEPLLHPNFVEVVEELIKSDNIRYVKIETNQTLPKPPFNNNKIHYQGRTVGRKHHIPYTISPIDLGYNITPNPRCPAITRCGYSLDKYGFLPCSPAIMIVRLFNLWDLYKKELPTEPWGLEEICKHCTQSLPKSWREQYSNRDIRSFTKEELEPSKLWREAKEKWDNGGVEEFYKSVKEY